MSVHAYVCACMCACMCACVRVCVHVCVHACMRACMHVFMYLYMYHIYDTYRTVLSFPGNPISSQLPLVLLTRVSTITPMVIVVCFVMMHVYY